MSEENVNPENPCANCPMCNRCHEKFAESNTEIECLKADLAGAIAELENGNNAQRDYARLWKKNNELLAKVAELETRLNAMKEGLREIHLQTSEVLDKQDQKDPYRGFPDRNAYDMFFPYADGFPENKDMEPTQR